MMTRYESDTSEFKEVTSGELSPSFWEPVSAFSNAEGGTIYLGIKSDGRVLGVESKYLDKIQQIVTTQCLNSFSHKLYPEVNIGRDRVMRVYIPPAPAALRPIYSTARGLPKGGRVRVGSVNVRLDDEWIRRFAIAARGGAELQPVQGDYLKHFTAAALEEYLSVVIQKRGNVYAGLETEEILVKLRALTEEKIMTVFGLLALSDGYSLQELIAPTLCVAVTQYAGIDKIDPNDPSIVSLDDREFAGSTVMQFEEALKFILSKLPVRSRVESGGRRKNYLTIPEIAIREVLANAIVHRDYTSTSGKIQVDIYVDRIEFSNPGRSLVPLNQIDSTYSETRNPLLMSYMRDLSVTEARARGIPTIKASLREAGLAGPKFEHKNDRFVATLYSTAFIDEDDQVWLRRFRQYNLTDRQLKALVHMRNEGSGISNSEYRALNNMDSVHDDDRAKRELVEMVQASILITTGGNRNRRYYLSDNE